MGNRYCFDGDKLIRSGRLEQCSTARHHLKFYFNVAVAATYTFPETFTLPVKDYIYRACEAVIQQHPILSAIPVGENTQEPYFVRLPEVDLDRSIVFQKRCHAFPEGDEKDAELETFLNIQHNTPFSPPLPHWRLCILVDEANERRFTAAFVFHHAIADGTSGKAFHKAFLGASQSASISTAETKSVIPSPSTPLLPNVEAVHPMPLSIPYLAIALFREKIWSPAKDLGLWTGSKVRVPLETQMQHIVIPKPLAIAFKESCREYNTTITAALQIMVARSFFTHLPTTFSQIQCSGALSTRRWLPESIITDDSIGVWVQDYHECYSRNDLTTDFFPWDRATQSRQTIQDVLSLQGKNASPNLLKYVNDIHQELFLSKIGQQRKSSFEMSNVGAFASGSIDTAKPQIGRMLFSQSASVTGSAVEVSVVSGGDGCLVLAFSWQKGVVEADFVKAVIENTEKELHTLV